MATNSNNDTSNGLFETEETPERSSNAEVSGLPLAARMRPRTLEEFAGQQGVVGEGTLLRRAIERDQLTSVLFWGPPGCGKSTLAQIIAHTTHAQFENYSAITNGVADVRKVIEAAGNWHKKPFSLWTKSIAGTKHSKTRCFRTSKTEP